MPFFEYKARTINGELTSGTLEAESVKAVALRLQAEQCYPVSITPGAAERGTIRSAFSRKRNVRHADITLFARRLADTLRGGLPLARALTVMEKQTENPEMRRITSEIRVAVQEGRGFAATLERFPSVFPSLFRGMVRIGESAGLLEIVLARLAEFSEKEAEWRHRIRAALAYPLVMLAVGIVSVIFLLTFVIPKFAVMFADSGQVLPWPTQTLIVLSSMLTHGWWVYLPGLALAIAGLRKLWRSQRGREMVDVQVMRIPVAGDFIRKELVARFIRMLSILMENGVPILDALVLAKNSVDNRVLAAEVDEISRSVREGRGLVEPLGKSRIFPPLVADMIAVGEETGTLESSLARIADIYEREVEYAVKTLASLIEPVIILIIGVMVAFIAISMLLPVFQMSSVIR